LTTADDGYAVATINYAFGSHMVVEVRFDLPKEDFC
jgi:hypothetical protein